MMRPKTGRSAKRFLRGQTWQVEEMLKLFLVILVFGGAVLLIIGATGGLTSILSDFCEKNPSWCGHSKADEDDYAMAQNSIKALVCAINSIVKGSEWPGSGCFYIDDPLQMESENQGGEESDSGPSIPLYDWRYSGNIVSKDYRDFITGLATESVQDKDSEIKTTINCQTVAIEKETYDARLVKFQHTDIIYTSDNIPNKEKYFDCSPYGWEDNGKIAMEEGISCYTCGDDKRIGNTKECEHVVNSEYICDIKNFQLPQRFEGTANAEEWIGGFGDPIFLVYWQSFPPGEETDWSSHSSWYKGIGTVAFGAMCLFGVKKGITSTIKAGGRIVKSSTTRAADYISSKVTGFKAGVLGDDTAKTIQQWETMFKYVEGSKIGTRNSIFSKLKPALIYQYKTKPFVKDSFNKFKAALPKTAVYTALASSITSVDAYLAKWVDSSFGKFFPDEKEPDKIMLHMPLNEREPFDLLTREIPKQDITDPSTQNLIKLNKPVVLDKKGINLGFFEAGDELKPLWFASPCRTDLKLKETEVVCGLYSYDAITGLTTCDNPQEPGWSDKTKIYRIGCGSLPNIDIKEISPQMRREVELIQDMDSIQIFKDNVEIKSVSREKGKNLECSCGREFQNFVTGEGLTLNEVISDCESKSGFKKNDILVGSCNEVGTPESSQVNIKAKQCKCTITFKGTRWPFGNEESYFVYGLDESDARRKCEAESESFKETEISLSSENAEIDKAEISECKDYEGDFLHSASMQGVAGKKFYEIYDPINKISFYFDRTTKNIEYLKNVTGVIEKILSPCSSDKPNSFLKAIGFEYEKLFICSYEMSEKITGYRRTKYTFIGTLAEDGNSLDKFMGLRIELIPELYTGGGITKSIILKDFSTTGEEEKTMNFDGKIDEVGEYLYLRSLDLDSPFKILLPSDILYQRAFVDSSPYDGVPDSIVSTDCKIRAIAVQPNMDPYQDEENNYCYKTDYSGVVDFATTTLSIGASVLTKVAKIGGPLGWVLSTATDCGLAIYSATSGASWPKH